MVVYKFRKKIAIQNAAHLTEGVLADIIEKAEEKSYRKLISEVGRRFIVFLIDMDLSRIEQNKNGVLLIFDLKVDLEISPLSRKVAEQDRIAKEIADVFVNEIEREINKFLAKNSI
ncbi:MAG: hypothetical protein Q6363_003940 [Candidatus Njordarchaeota archaeon]